MEVSDQLRANFTISRLLPIVALGSLAGIIVHIYLLSSEGFVYAEMRPLGFPIVMIAGTFISYFILFFSEVLNGKFKWEVNAGGRLITGILLNTLFAFGIFWMLYRITWPLLASSVYAESSFTKVTALKLAIIVTVIVFVFSIVYYASFSYQTFVRGRITRSALAREMMEIQMATLRNQLRPHFLFNSLNTASSLMRRNLDSAEEFIRRLANSYQYTLTNYNKNSITVNEELDFTKSYLDMMQARIGGGLAVDIQISKSALEKEILPLTIQLLVENALKHNVIHKEEPIRISILGVNDRIRVSNNKTSRPAQVISTKIGLSNLARRYQLWNNSTIRIVDGSSTFSVEIPLI